jgi:NAD(P)-dependent dehydrogenase (short-subunit alcohol dehydrogenase family)
MSLWPGAKRPDLTGKLAVITGANSGIGFYTALELERAGASVILACRSLEKGEAAVAKIGGKAVVQHLDLADLDSVHAFAAAFKERHGTLDLLINNAGVMAPPARQVTKQDFEQQFGVNFLGHFLLTSLLLGPLTKAPAPRVVQLSSIAHRQGVLNFDDIMAERHYQPWTVYQQSKLAMLVFAQELARRSAAGGWGVLSLAAHPGIAKTELVSNGPGGHSATAVVMWLADPFVRQSAEAGAWPSILAATGANAKPGDYYGPQGFMEFRGPPGLGKAEPKALDAASGKRLWELAEKLTGAP